jgi:type IV fimbrial biogenesis protein FimT
VTEQANGPGQLAVGSNKAAAHRPRRAALGWDGYHPRMKTQDFIRDSSAAFALRSGGFTLIELLVTVSIAAIMLTIAIPSFREFLLNNRLASQTNALVLALAYAKSEAITRGLPVTVCSRSTDTACAGSTNWDTGWLVFVDNDGSGAVNGTDLILQVRAPLEGGNTLRAGARQQVTFQNTGLSTSADTLSLCDGRGAASGKRIIVSMVGRVSTQTGGGTCP